MTFQNGALSGLKVLDLSRILAGPYCSQILSDHGAEIIKVESPMGDETRRWGPPFRVLQDGSQESAYFAGINRNKKSLCLDLTDPVAQKTLKLLLMDADILIENFKPGTMAEKFALSDDDIQTLFPRLLHCRITGFGSEGPLAESVGFDAAVQAWSGLMSINGTVEPTKVGVPIVDLVTGMQAAFAILAAVVERERSGRGQLIETSLYENALAILHPQMSNYFFSGRMPGVTGNRHPNIAPYDSYKALDRALYIACGNDTQFVGLCEVLGVSEVVKDFTTNSVRVQKIAELEMILRPRIASFTAAKLVDALLAHGVPAGLVQNFAEVAAHPQTHALGAITEFQGQKFVGSPVKFSRSQTAVYGMPPRLGEQSDQILKNIALTQDEREHLLKRGSK